MKIEHIALWASNLDEMRDFYARYFGGTAGDKYVNSKRGYESYFVTFETGSRLEIMYMPSVPANANDLERQALGWIHIAFAVGSKENVDSLTERLRADGYRVIGEPRTTGDGYYESVVLDPEGNRVEITA